LKIFDVKTMIRSFCYNQLSIKIVTKSNWYFFLVMFCSEHQRESNIFLKRWIKRKISLSPLNTDNFMFLMIISDYRTALNISAKEKSSSDFELRTIFRCSCFRSINFLISKNVFVSIDTSIDFRREYDKKWLGKMCHLSIVSHRIWLTVNA